MAMVSELPMMTWDCGSHEKHVGLKTDVKHVGFGTDEKHPGFASDEKHAGCRKTRRRITGTTSGIWRADEKHVGCRKRRKRSTGRIRRRIWRACRWIRS